MTRILAFPLILAVLLVSPAAATAQGVDRVAVLDPVPFGELDAGRVPLGAKLVETFRQRLAGWFEVRSAADTRAAEASVAAPRGKLWTDNGVLRRIGRAANADFVFPCSLGPAEGGSVTIVVKAFDVASGGEQGPWQAYVREEEDIPAAVETLMTRLDLTDEEPDPGPVMADEPWAYQKETMRRFAALLETPAWRAAEPARNAQGMLEAVHVRSGLGFVLIPAGAFDMGEAGWSPYAMPVHRVTVPAFLLARTECTQQAWDRLGGEDERKSPGPTKPIDSVTWDAARAWCGKAGLRLPAEAEWEYACRAGTQTGYAHGNDARLLTKYGWGRKNFDSKIYNHPVALLRPNRWGLHDMHGNVSEWCEDLWHVNYVGAPGDGSARTDGESEDRPRRGGSAGSVDARCSSRYRTSATLTSITIGFRPAASLPR